MSVGQKSSVRICPIFLSVQLNLAEPIGTSRCFVRNILPAVTGQLWLHLRTNLTSVLTSRKMKMMFYLVDTCGKELADCLEKITADGKLPKTQYSYKIH